MPRKKTGTSTRTTNERKEREERKERRTGVSLTAKAVMKKKQRKIEDNEISEIQTFFISNLLPPSLIQSLRDMKNEEELEFLTSCFAYEQYIMNPPRNSSNIMGRGDQSKQRLYHCTITNEIYRNLQSSIRREYTNNFMEIFNTHM